MSDETTSEGFSANRAWVWGLVLLFGSMFAANGVMIYFANADSASQVVADRAYELGLQYDDALDLAAKTRATGWDYEAAPCAGGLCVRLSDEGDAPLAGARVAATLMRPSNSKLDRRLELTEVDEPGLYRAAAPLAPGLWELTLDVSRDERVARWTQRLYWPK